MVLKARCSFGKIVKIVLVRALSSRGSNLRFLVNIFYEYESIKLYKQGEFYTTKKDQAILKISYFENRRNCGFLLLR